MLLSLLLANMSDDGPNGKNGNNDDDDRNDEGHGANHKECYAHGGIGGKSMRETKHGYPFRILFSIIPPRTTAQEQMPLPSVLQPSARPHYSIQLKYC